MGPQTTRDDRRRPRFGVALLAAVGVTVAALGATALAAPPRVASGAQADSLDATFPTVFDTRTTARNIQIADFTVTNTGETAVPIKSVAVSSPWRIIPGDEDCTGATIGPLRYCVVMLEFTPVGKDVRGQVTATAADGSVITRTLDATDVPLDAPQPSTVGLDYGSLPVGTTSPQQTVTLQAAPQDFMIMNDTLTVPTVPPPNAAGDYHVPADTCSGTDIAETQTCAMGVTATPAAAGTRPAFLDITYCDPFNFEFGDGGRTVPPSPPPGEEQTCGINDSEQTVYADHILVALTVVGTQTTTTTTQFTPTLQANPAVVPAGRTTMVSGNGFPDNATVTFALVPVGTATNANLTTVPGFRTVQTDGTGAFQNANMLVMPHTAPSSGYEILAETATPASNAIAAFLVAPGMQEPPKFVTRH